MVFMSTILAAICIFSLRGTKADKCSNTAHSLRNMKLQHNIIKTESGVRDVPACLDKCSKHGSCHSINFDESKAACELNSANHLSKPDHMTYSHGMVYMKYFLRPASKCSKAYCRKNDQECVMDKDGTDYKCIAKQCQDILSFPGKSTTDKAYLEHAFESLSTLTLEFWIQIETKGLDSLTEPTAFSYATTSNSNEIVIFTKKGTGYGFILKDANVEILDASVANGQWHHITLTWESTGGQYKIFIDGVIRKQGVTGAGSPIDKGMLILGNDQDSYNGGFTLSESYQGNITNVNIWNNTFTQQQVSVLAKSCSNDEGNAVSWSQLKKNIVGNIGSLCTISCV